MDGRHDPLSDSALDRELDAALNGEPSPEFVARVRMRVASEPAPAGWWPRWRFVVAGACAATLVVALALWSNGESSPAAPRISADEALPPAVVEPAPISDRLAAEVLVPARPDAPVAPRPRRLARVENGRREILLDDVIVSAEDRRGFEALLVAVEERRLPVLPREEPGADPGTTMPIEIPGVVIEPLEMLQLE